MKKLAGAIAVNQETQFMFIYGASTRLVVEGVSGSSTSGGLVP